MDIPADILAFLEANWPIALIAFAIAFALVWLIARANRTTTVKISRDVLDDGEGPAARNQALIDAPTPNADKDDTATSASAPAPVNGEDDLTQIKGLGPKLAALLKEHGITSFAQIAAWDDAEIERIDAKLGRFQGRITRDNWVEQAKHLSIGNAAVFAEKYGQNG